jgi:hypothetical protein
LQSVSREDQLPKWSRVLTRRRDLNPGGRNTRKIRECGSNGDTDVFRLRYERLARKTDILQLRKFYALVLRDALQIGAMQNSRRTGTRQVTETKIGGHLRESGDGGRYIASENHFGLNRPATWRRRRQRK